MVSPVLPTRVQKRAARSEGAKTALSPARHRAHASCRMGYTETVVSLVIMMRDAFGVWRGRSHLAYVSKVPTQRNAY